MDSPFHVPRTLTLTTEPSWTPPSLIFECYYNLFNFPSFFPFHIPFIALDLCSVSMSISLAHVGTWALLCFHTFVVVQEGTSRATAAWVAVLGALKGGQIPQGGTSTWAHRHTLVELEWLGAGLGCKWQAKSVTGCVVGLILRVN